MSRALIGREPWSIRVPREWRDGGPICVFLFLARAIFWQTSTEVYVKTFNVKFIKKQIENNFSWSVLLSTIEMTGMKGSELKNTDHGKLLSIC